MKLCNSVIGTFKRFEQLGRNPVACVLAVVQANIKLGHCRCRVAVELLGQFNQRRITALNHVLDDPGNCSINGRIKFGTSRKKFLQTFLKVIVGGRKQANFKSHLHLPWLPLPFFLQWISKLSLSVAWMPCLQSAGR